MRASESEAADTEDAPSTDLFHPEEPSTFPERLQCGMYVYYTHNRPLCCKPGVTTKLTRRFGEHCVHDARHTALYAVTVSVDTDYDNLGPGLSRASAMQGVCDMARDLEAYVLGATHEHHDPSMQSEWRLFDVTTLADDIEQYAQDLNELYPFVSYTVRRNWRPPPDTVERTPLENVVGVDPPRNHPTPVADALHELRPYQEEALAEAIAHYNSDDRNADKAQLVWACGLGKTLFAVKLAQRLDAGHILVATPYSHLVDQFAATVVRELADSGHACVLVRGRRCTVHGESRTFETAALGDWLVEHPRTVVISTYASVYRLTQLGRPFDLVVCDEAHHLCGTTDTVQNGTTRRGGVRRQGAEEAAHANEGANGNGNEEMAIEPDASEATSAVGVYEKVLDVETRRTLFLTATPIDATDPATEQRNVRRWMDDPNVFGKRLTERTLAWAIDNKYVADFEVRALEMSSAHLEQLFEITPGLKAVFEQLHATRDDNDLTTSQRLFCAAWATVKALFFGDSRRQIVYTNSHSNGKWVEQCARRIVRALDEEQRGSTATVTAPSVDVWYADSNMSFAERAHTLKRFQDPSRPPSMLVNVYLFSEGTDIPCADGVTLAEPMKSYVRGTQSLTRCLRLDPDDPNKCALVLLPVFVTGPPTVGLHDTTYAEIGQLLDRFRGADRECFVTKMTVFKGCGCSTSTPNESRTADTLGDAATVNVEATRELQFHLMDRYSRALSLKSLYAYLHSQGVHDKNQYAEHRQGRSNGLRERLPDDVHTAYPEFGWVHTVGEHPYYETGPECQTAIRKLRRDREKKKKLDACRNNKARNRKCNQWDERVPIVPDGALHRYYGGTDAPREEMKYYT